MMLQCETASDFIIATGVSHSLEEFVAESFAALDLDWRDHTVASTSLFRPADISDGKGNAGKAERLLGWKAKAHMREVISRMVGRGVGKPWSRKVSCNAGRRDTRDVTSQVLWSLLVSFRASYFLRRHSFL